MDQKQLSKGKRLGWVPLKDAKKVRLTIGLIKGKKIIPQVVAESSEPNVYLIP